MTDLAAIDREYREIGPTTMAVWGSEFEKVRSPLLPFAEAMHGAADPHSALCLAQMWLENQYATTGIIIQPEDCNPLSMRPWREDPTATVDGTVLAWDTRIQVGTIKDAKGKVIVKDGQIRVPPGAVGAVFHPKGGMFLRFSDPVAAVREWRRRIIDDRAYKGGVYNDCHTLTEMLDTYAPADDTHPETGLPNKDAKYEEAVRAKLGQFAAVEQMQETPMADMQAVQFVGLAKPVMLPADIKVTIDIVPGRFIGWVRSGQRFTGQTKTTFHDTGAPGQNARAQRNYLHNGPAENGQHRQVGFNFAVDDREIIQLVPLDEVTWAAGTVEGNRTSWHVEQCFGAGIDWDKSLRNAIALHAGLIAAKGWATDTALVKHQYWYGKWCPGQVLNRGLWPSVVKGVSDAALVAAGAAVGGQVPTPVYATPVPIPELAAFTGKPESEIPYRVDGDGWVALYVGDRVRAAKDTPRFRYSGGGDEMVGPLVKAGEEFDVDWLLISVDFPDTYLTPWNTRIRAGDTQRISDVKADAKPANGG
jgi:hypothetical protein